MGEFNINFKMAKHSYMSLEKRGEDLALCLNPFFVPLPSRHRAPTQTLMYVWYPLALSLAPKMAPPERPKQHKLGSYVFSWPGTTRFHFSAHKYMFAYNPPGDQNNSSPKQFYLQFRNNFAIPLESQHETKNAYTLSNGKAEWVRPNGPETPLQGLLWVRPTLILFPTILLATKIL